MPTLSIFTFAICFVIITVFIQNKQKVVQIWQMLL